MKQFFKDAKLELSQVTWLTQKQAVKLAAITVVFVISSAVLLWAVDTLLSKAYHVL